MVEPVNVELFSLRHVFHGIQQHRNLPPIAGFMTCFFQNNSSWFLFIHGLNVSCSVSALTSLSIKSRVENGKAPTSTEPKLLVFTHNAVIIVLRC